jgi:hypothetical protein
MLGRTIQADADYGWVRIYKWLLAVREEGCGGRYWVSGNGVWLGYLLTFGESER